MSRGPSAIKKLPEHQYKRLLYFIADLRVNQKIRPPEIAPLAVKWVKENAPEYYTAEGKTADSTIGRYFSDAIEKGFLKLQAFYDQELATQIVEKFDLKRLPFESSKIEVIVAPNRDEMLRYVWLDLDRHLTHKMAGEKPDRLVVGVSGGHTMLKLGELANNLKDLAWHKEIPEEDRRKTLICSLTSGGIRSDTAALSDTVAANIGNFLNAQSRGLLGPAWFEGKDALETFRSEPEVDRHIKLANEADIIITSVGYLGDPNNLLTRLLKSQGQGQFLDDHKNSGDILYHPYNGATGEPIDLPPKFASGLLSVMSIDDLCDKVERGLHCIVLASGEEKGMFALPGILRKKIASHIYIDYDCANALISGSEIPKGVK